jgi:hypothetical protein
MQLLELCKLSNDRVESQNPFCFWEVDGYKLDNKHLVMWYEKSYGTKAKFVYRDYDLLKDNLKNTTIDLDHYYHLDFLKYLRSRYKTVKLLYSGGTDSATILDMAYLNNIMIDDTITLFIEDINLPSNSEQKNIAIPGLEKYKSIIGKSHMVKIGYDVIETHFKDHYSFFSSPCDCNFPVGFSAAKYGPLEEYQSGNDTCIISGIDKPEIVFYNGRWYATMIDNAVAFGDQSVTNLLPFYMDARNIKGYVKDCILYRNWLIKKNRVSRDNWQLFRCSAPVGEQSRIINRIDVDNSEYLIANNKAVTNGEKHQLRFKECFGLGNFTFFTKYFKAVETFYNVFPDVRTESGLKKYHSNGKFAWFIDLDSLEVHTQDGLIPNGFEKQVN